MHAPAEAAAAELERALDALDAPGGLAGLAAAAAALEHALGSNPAGDLEQFERLAARIRAAIARLEAARDTAVRELFAARLLLDSLRAQRAPAGPRIDCRG